MERSEDLDTPVTQCLQRLIVVIPEDDSVEIKDPVYISSSLPFDDAIALGSAALLRYVTRPL